MSTPSERQAELQALLQRLSDDARSPEDAQRLNDLLHGDAQACEKYLDHLTLEAHLRSEFGGRRPALEALPAFARGSERRASEELRAESREQRAEAVLALRSPLLALRSSEAELRAESREQRAEAVLALRSPLLALRSSEALRPLLSARFAAGLLLGALLMLAGLLGRRSLDQPLASKPEREESNPAPAAEWVATLLFADNCQWAKRDPPAEGQRLPVGRLHLERGLAVLRFDGGAAVVLEGPTELDVESRVSARLASGRLTVRAPAEAAGFTVHTPASEVVDLGTEFALVVERGGATELHVLEGEVAYSKPGTLPELAEVLGAGKAVRYDEAAKESPRVVPLNAPRFTELLRQAKIGPREDLLLAHEGFNYPGSLPLSKANGGSGWAGPWRLSPGSKPPVKGEGELPIGFGKLNVTWPIQGGRGPMLEAPPDYLSRVRFLARPVRLDEDGVYYVSVLVRWEPPPPDVPTKQLPAVRLVLRAADNMRGDHVMFNLPISQRPQIEMRSGAIFTSAQTVQRNETQLWVGKIVARRQGEDEVFFRIYSEGDPLDPIEPAAWSVRSRGVRSDARLDVLLLSKFSGGTCWWDEVRIGKSWRAVVPAGALAKNSK